LGEKREEDFALAFPQKQHTALACVGWMCVRVAISKNILIFFYKEKDISIAVPNN
jgi:hypothetical protein